MSLSFDIPALTATCADQLEAELKNFGLSTYPYGQLGDLIRKIANVQSRTDIELQQLRHLIFCGDHGIYEHSQVTKGSEPASAGQLARLLSEKSPIATVCRQHNIELNIIDCGLSCVEPPPAPALISHRVASGCRNFASVAAMSRDQLEAAVQTGVELASLKLAEGARILSFAAMGQGHNTSAQAITMALLNVPADRVVNHHNRHEPEHYDHRVNILTQALVLHRRNLTDTWEIIRILGGFEIAALMGAMLITAELGGVFLVDGYACSAALLAAHSLYPNVLEHAILSHRSAHVAQEAIVKKLGLKPLLDLNLTLGEGFGSLLAWPMISSTADAIEKAIHPD